MEKWVYQHQSCWPNAWSDSLTCNPEVPGLIRTGSWFFCAVTRGTVYSWPGMREKCTLCIIGYIILGRNARLYSDIKLKYLYLYLSLPVSVDNKIYIYIISVIWQSNGYNDPFRKQWYIVMWSGDCTRVWGEIWQCIGHPIFART